MLIDNNLDTAVKECDIARKDTADSAVSEAQAGKEDLVKEQKTFTEFLKKGGRSGISGQFGRPDIFDSLETLAKVAATDSAMATGTIDSQTRIRSFDYDRQTGELMGFQENSDRFTRQQDGTYIKEGSDPPEVRTNVKVLPFGGFQYTDQQTEQRITDTADGRKIVRNKDGTEVETDSEGRLKGVTYAPPAGGERVFEYDEEGRLSGFAENGERWTRQEDGVYVKDGSNPPQVRTEARTDSVSGGFVYIDNSTGETVSQTPDGIRTVCKPAGFMVMFDSSGRPMSTFSPAGPGEKDANLRIFIYDSESGKLSEFQENGKTFIKQDDGSFVQKGSDPPVIRTDVEVLPQGGFSYTDQSIKQQITETADGRRMVKHNDGSEVETDNKGLLKAVTYPNPPGGERIFEYDEKGGVTNFAENGERWSRQDDGNFVKDGSNPPEIRKDVRTDAPSGGFAYTDARTGDQVIHTADGTRTVKQSDGAWTMFDPQGRPLVHNAPAMASLGR